MVRKMLFLVMFIGFNIIASAQDYDWMEAKSIEFCKDTATVEEEVRGMLDRDYSTSGMIEAANYLEKGYDKLLNKYYKLTMSILNDDNKKRLQTSQRKWIALRDADRDLVTGMVVQIREDVGGGTIWGVIGADARADITRRRVIELYNYMMFSKMS